MGGEWVGLAALTDLSLAGPSERKGVVVSLVRGGHVGICAPDSSREVQILFGGDKGMSVPSFLCSDQVALGVLGPVAGVDHPVQDVTGTAVSVVSDGGEEADCICPMISMGLSVVGGSLCWARVASSLTAPVQVKATPMVMVDCSRCWECDDDQQDAPPST